MSPFGVNPDRDVTYSVNVLELRQPKKLAQFFVVDCVMCVEALRTENRKVILISKAYGLGKRFVGEE